MLTITRDAAQSQQQPRPREDPEVQEISCMTSLVVKGLNTEPTPLHHQAILLSNVLISFVLATHQAFKNSGYL